MRWFIGPLSSFFLQLTHLAPSEQWELHCTAATDSTFSVCLGPAERRAFEAQLLEDGGASVIEALSKIDVLKAKTGNAAVRYSVCFSLFFGRSFAFDIDLSPYGL